MPRWYMEKKGIAYELIEVSVGAGQSLQGDFLSINPFCKLPVMRDDSILNASGDTITIFESGAILLHLAEHHSNEIKRPIDLSLISQWTHFANSTLAICDLCT